jgi:hypothetical protein
MGGLSPEAIDEARAAFKEKLREEKKKATK